MWWRRVVVPLEPVHQVRLVCQSARMIPCTRP
jgi:hypothetical protein